ncbi:MAG: YciI family protein [Verrucomicrobiota bacterium]
MPLFVVTFTHPDPVGWKQHLSDHLDWLVAGVESGRIRASGDTPQTPIRSALLIVSAADGESAAEFISTDPFVIKGQVGEMTITEWSPYFGALNNDSELAGMTAPEVASFIRSRLL